MKTNSKKGILLSPLPSLICAAYVQLQTQAAVSVTDENWKAHELARFESCGRESLADGDNKKAADYFAKALTFKYESHVAILEAQCFINMQAWKEARAILKKLFSRQGYDEEFELLIQCDLKLKLYKDALAECDAFEKNLVLNKGAWVQRNKIYEAMGKPALASTALKEGYYHCLRTGQDSSEIKCLLKQCKQPVPTDTPKIKTANKEVIALVGYLYNLKRPAEEKLIAANFERITRRKLSFVGAGSSGDWRVFDCSAPTEALEIGANRISFSINPDYSYVTKNDLVSANIPALSSKNTKWIGCGQQKLTYELPAENGTIFLSFNPQAQDQLLMVGRSFTPACVKAFEQSYIDETIKHAENLIQKGQRDEAAKYLVEHWLFRHIDMSAPGAEQTVTKIKKLLHDSLKNKPAVAKYVDAAPYAAITNDVVNSRFDVSKLPSIEEFQKHRWTARPTSGQTADKPMIFVALEDYQCGSCLQPGMQLYETVAEQIRGYELSGPAVYISPITAKDADAFLFQH